MNEADTCLLLINPALQQADWEVKPLGEVLDITIGQSPPSEFYNEQGDGLPYHQGVRDYGYRFPTHRVYCPLDGIVCEVEGLLNPLDTLLGNNESESRTLAALREALLPKPLSGKIEITTVEAVGEGAT